MAMLNNQMVTLLDSTNLRSMSNSGLARAQNQ
jgi:hypothetical protein